MTDSLTSRRERLRALLQERTGSEPERIARAMESLAGLSSTEMSAPDWKRILRHLKQINAVLAPYEIKVTADYARITPADLVTIRSQLMSLSGRLRARPEVAAELPVPHR